MTISPVYSHGHNADFVYPLIPPRVNVRKVQEVQKIDQEEEERRDCSPIINSSSDNNFRLKSAAPLALNEFDNHQQLIQTGRQVEHKERRRTG